MTTNTDTQGGGVEAVRRTRIWATTGVDGRVMQTTDVSGNAEAWREQGFEVREFAEALPAAPAAPAAGVEAWRSVLSDMTAAMYRYGAESGEGDIPPAHRNLLSRAERLLDLPAPDAKER